MKATSFNTGWTCRHLGSSAPGTPVTLPHDAMLAEETGAHVHICHVSTARSVDIIRKMKKKGIHLTCETCPQYFSLTEDEVLEQGAMARVNPPLRRKRRSAQCWNLRAFTITPKYT